MSAETDAQAVRIVELERELEQLRAQHNTDLLAEQNADNYPAVEEAAETPAEETTEAPFQEAAEAPVVPPVDVAAE